MTFCIVEANYWETLSIARPLCNSRAACYQSTGRPKGTEQNLIISHRHHSQHALLPHSFTQGVSHTPIRGVNTPKLSHNTPGFRRKGGERKRGGRGKGREEEKGRKGTPRVGWHPPCSKSWKIPCPNPKKCPAITPGSKPTFSANPSHHNRPLAR